MRLRIQPVLTALCFLLSIPTAARASWTPDGTLLCDTTGSYDVLDATPDGAGGVFVLWRDGSSPKMLRLGRVTPDGDLAPGWPDCGLLVSDAYALHSLGIAELVPDGLGGVFVAWWGSGVTGGALSVQAQHFTSGGALAAGWPTAGVGVSTLGGWDIRALPDGDGGLYVAFGSATYRVHVQRIQANGAVAPGWPSQGYPISATNARDPAIVSDGAGGVFVAWTDYRSGKADFDLYAQHLTPAGTLSPGWPAAGVALSTAAGMQGGNSNDMGLLGAPDGQGGALFVYLSATALSQPHDIYAQRITSAGLIAPGWPADGLPVCTAVGDQAFSSTSDIVSDGAGGAIVAWTDTRDDSQGDIYAQRVASGGYIPNCWPVDGAPVCIAPNYQWWPSLSEDGFGGVVVTWQDHRAIPVRDYVQRLTAAGQVAPGWPVDGAPLTTPFESNHPHAAFVGHGTTMVAFMGNKPGWTAGSVPIVQQVAVGPEPPLPVGYSYWRFEQANGGVVPDESGNGADAQLLNGAPLSSSVEFPGVQTESSCQANLSSLNIVPYSGGVAIVPDGCSIRPADQLTIELWVRPESGPWAILGKQFGAGCCSNSYQLEVRSGYYNFILSGPDGGQHMAFSSVEPVLGQWAHLAGTWDGTTQRLYLNGVEIASGSFSGPIGYDGNPLLIGADDDGYGIPGCCYYNGLIDEVRITNRALSPPEFLSQCSTASVGPLLAAPSAIQAIPSLTSRGTVVRLSRPVQGEAVVTVFDIEGRCLRRLELPDGATSVAWDGRDEVGAWVPSGIYLIQLRSSGFSGITRLVVAR